MGTRLQGRGQMAEGKKDFSRKAYFSRDVENLSPNLSPCRREALIFPPSLLGKGVRGLGFSWTFPHGVKSQVEKGVIKADLI
jgi:hypothetical protein